MATRALIGYLNEDRVLTCTYNHYDGYPDHLGKVLDEHFSMEESAEAVANEGYISYIDDDGNIEAKNKRAPSKKPLGGDLDWEDALYAIADEINDYGADYAYIWYEGDGDWSEIKNTGTRSMVDQLANQLNSASNLWPVAENKKKLDENAYKEKWQEFITENKAIDDQWSIYVKSLINSIRLNGVEDYVDFNEDDFVEDFNNYIADKMDV